jgi:hypothetical protein
MDDEPFVGELWQRSHKLHADRAAEKRSFFWTIASPFCNSEKSGLSPVRVPLKNKKTGRARFTFVLIMIPVTSDPFL